MRQAIYFFVLFGAVSTLFSQIATKHTIKNTKGDIELYLSNNGTFGQSGIESKSAIIWPRNSKAQYVYGGGAMIFQYNANISGSKQVAECVYEAETGSGWFTAGSILDGDTLQSDLASKYRVYSSINYDHNTGEELFGGTGPNWCVWSGNDYLSKKFGNYVVKEEDRTLSTSTPRFISDEDLIAISKDTDKRYNDGMFEYPDLLPLRLDVETRVYCFDGEEGKNVVFVNWIVTNRGDRELDDLSFAPIFDVDITKTTNAYVGVMNDIILFPQDSSYVSFATQMGDYEKGEPFGYITFKWLETPLMSGKTVSYSSESNQRLETFVYRQMPADLSYKEISDDFIKNGSSTIEQVGYQKFLAPTHRFNLPANQSASFVMQINMTSAGEAYPDMSAEKREEIENELSSNEDLYEKRLTNVEIADGNGLIDIYPNPASASIDVEVELPFGEQMSIELFDLSGKSLGVLYRGTHYKQKYALDLGERAKGVYLLRFSVGTHNYSKKLVVSE